MCTIDLSTKSSQTESSVFYWGAFFGVLFFVPKDIAEHFLTQKKILSNAKTWGDLFDGDRELYEDLKERIEERIDRHTCCDWKSFCQQPAAFADDWNWYDDWLGNLSIRELEDLYYRLPHESLLDPDLTLSSFLSDPEYWLDPDLELEPAPPTEYLLRHYLRLKPGERLPVLEDPFEPAIFFGYEEGLLRSPLGQLEGLVPKDIYRKFARTTSTTLDGNLEVFDEKDLDDVLTALGRLGYRCIHNDDLIVELR